MLQMLFGDAAKGKLLPNNGQLVQVNQQLPRPTQIVKQFPANNSKLPSMYYYLCWNDVLALGGGGSFELCLDGDLLHGTSGPWETFGNLYSAHNPEFELKNVELLYLIYLETKSKFYFR
ncbi:uncharacterized protein LOC131227933 [Magnolia sinica]|uniref:uncharacterized protein LOC131227933 n=1 Tax=Magnolia sinica TaxID=86752 RepID=UPI002659D2B7|nr:uncharacterized protein LOC131227933 [Magnolia sinica]